MEETVQSGDVAVVNVNPRWVLLPILVFALSLSAILGFVWSTDGAAREYVVSLATECAADTTARQDAKYFAAISEKFYYWQATACLFLVVSIGAVILSGYIWLWCIRTAEDRLRLIYASVVIAVLLLTVFSASMRFAEGKGTFYAEHFIDAIDVYQRHTAYPAGRDLETDAIEDSIRIIRKIGLGAAFIAATGFFALLIFPGKVHTELLSQRMKMLRVLLYFGAVMFVSGILLLGAEASWLGAVFGAGSVFEKGVEGVVRGGTERAGVVYTTMMGSVYVPCFWVLYRAAQDLGKKATGEGEAEAVREWMKANGVGTSWQQVVRSAVAVMAPVLSAPIGDLLKQLLGGGMG